MSVHCCARLRPVSLGVSQSAGTDALGGLCFPWWRPTLNVVNTSRTSPREDTSMSSKTAAEKATKTEQQPSPAKAINPQPTTGPKSGRTTNRKPNPKDQGHTLVRIVGPYATRSGRFEVTWTCQCGKTARPYVKNATDLAAARSAHQRHAAKTVA